jgi:hypothetical protein
LNGVLGEEGRVLACEGRSFQPGPRIILWREFDNVAGQGKFVAGITQM